MNDGARGRVNRPKLRPIEVVVVPDEVHGRALMLRDTEGVAEGAVIVPGPLAAVVSRFDGRSTVDQIAAAATRASGQPIDAGVVEQLAQELDLASMLDSPRYRARRLEVRREFAELAVRPASHAGGAYHGDAAELARFIDRECLARGRRRRAAGRMVGLCAPHMDLWRAAEGYGHAYRACADDLPPEVDTFVLLGTCHAAMRRPFAVCAKAFATPLGDLEPDRAVLDELASRSRFDVREEEYLHRTEHSLEFQAVFLRHLLGERRAKIVPILCGLGDAQANGRDPAKDGDAESFVDALRDIVDRLGPRALIVAGADLAHVGPRFGDPRPLDAAQRAALEERDRASIARALSRDAPAFFDHVVEDLRQRRVCGVGPIYTLLRALPAAARGEELNYAQHVDPDEGSIVSHTSLGFYV